MSRKNPVRFTLFLLAALLHVAAAGGLERAQAATTDAPSPAFVEIPASLTFSGSEVPVAEVPAAETSPAGTDVADTYTAKSVSTEGASPSDQVQRAEHSADPAHSGHLERHPDKRHHPAVDPDHVRFLFALQRHAQPLSNLLRHLPTPWSESDTKPVTSPGHPTEVRIRYYVTATIASSETIHLSQTVRELLFPFHHFL